MNDIGSAIIREEMKDFCLLKTCRRQYICDHFGCDFTQHTKKHQCCDVCKDTCKCEDCIERCMCENLEQMEIPASEVESQDIFDVLQAYFDAENEIACSNVVTTGLSSKLVREIVLKNNLQSYSSEEDILKDFPYLQRLYVSNIYLIISQFN